MEGKSKIRSMVKKETEENKGILQMKGNYGHSNR